MKISIEPLIAASSRLNTLKEQASLVITSADKFKLDFDSLSGRVSEAEKEKDQNFFMNLRGVMSDASYQASENALKELRDQLSNIASKLESAKAAQSNLAAEIVEAEIAVRQQRASYCYELEQILKASIAADKKLRTKLLAILAVFSCGSSLSQTITRGSVPQVSWPYVLADIFPEPSQPEILDAISLLAQEYKIPTIEL